MIFNKFFILFKIGRKIGKSNIINIVSETHKIPVFIKLFFNLLAFSFSGSNDTKNEGKENLSASIQEMGTTFIKLGQFLATRPDIIGEKLSKELESLQDKLPPFSKKEAEKIIIENLGQSNFDDIIDLSDPIAAASIAQVHKAKIKEDNIIKNVAIKVLRPNIKKIFNDEIDAIMLLAYMVESLITKTKRLKLIEVVFLFKEITNHEMDLRFEAAAANEYAENTKNDLGFFVPKIYWNFTSESVLTLDWVDGVSIREKDLLKEKNIETSKIATNLIQHFLRHAVRDGFFHADMHQGNIFINESSQIVR